MKKSIQIANAKPDEIEAILKMHAQSWIDTYPDEAASVSREWVEKRVNTWLMPENIKKRQDTLARLNQDPSFLYKVAKDDTLFIGILFVRREATGQHLQMLYVDKNYHGTGVAQALMKEFLEWEDPLMTTDLEVASYNERAKAFYRKYGFKEVSGSQHLFDNVIPVVTMIRKGEKQ